jgi:hypothetical protein
MVYTSLLYRRTLLCTTGSKAWRMIAEATKVCGGKHGCGRDLPLSSFRFYNKALGKRQGTCRECCNRHERERYKIPEVKQRKNRATRAWAAANPGKMTRLRVRYRCADPARALFFDARTRARARGLAFDLTQEWFAEKLRSGTCELTGLPFDYGKHSLRRPSPDRCDNNVGYTQENCRIVLLGLNLLKKDHEELVFRKFLSDVADALNEQKRAV